MASKSKAQPAALPRSEICAYWVLSFGSHLYSFYDLHRFSKEHEAGLEREFQLEEGFLIGGVKKDSTDFEWSFWSYWANRSLLWTLFGHAVVSILSNLFVPRFRVAMLSGYGLLVACGALGVKGMAVVIVHLGLSLAVAQLRRPIFTWSCALLLLFTLHIHPLQELKVSHTWAQN